MGTMIRMPYNAKTVAEIWNFIEQRFADVGNCQFGTMRAIAHDAVRQLLEGNPLAARNGFMKLGADGERAMKNELRRLGIELESAK